MLKFTFIIGTCYRQILIVFIEIHGKFFLSLLKYVIAWYHIFHKKIIILFKFNFLSKKEIIFGFLNFLLYELA